MAGHTLTVDLVQCLLRRAIYLQLDDVNGVGQLHHEIDAAVGTLHLCAGIHVEHVENQLKGVFVKSFIVFHLFQLLFEALHAWDTRQKSLHLLHRGINIVMIQRTPKLESKAVLNTAAVQAYI